MSWVPDANIHTGGGTKDLIVRMHLPEHFSSDTVERDDGGIARLEFFPSRPEDNVARAIAIEIGNAG